MWGLVFFDFCVYVLLVAVSLVVSISAVDCLEGLVFEVICYVSSGTT